MNAFSDRLRVVSHRVEDFGSVPMILAHPQMSSLPVIM